MPWTPLNGDSLPAVLLGLLRLPPRCHRRNALAGPRRRVPLPRLRREELRRRFATCRFIAGFLFLVAYGLEAREGTVSD